MMNTKIIAVLILTCLQVKAQTGRKTEEGEDCTCIPINQCGFGKSLDVTIRQLDECDNHLDICCAEENSAPEIPPNPPAATCGHRNREGLFFHLTDADLESQYAEFPWMIEISVERMNIWSKLAYRYIAGGSLITPSAVLTAAHKMKNVNVAQLRVRAGEWERNTVDKPYPHQDRKVNQLIIHEYYNATHGFNGIAMLILETPINLEGHINTICLPPKNYDFTGNECFVSGWGADAREDDNRVGKPVDILKKINLPVVSKSVCQRQLQNTRLGPRFRVHRRFMCAGGEKDKDACFGDGGSPLVCPIPNAVDKYYLAGIVIGGVNCGLDKVPGLYIEVSKFISWINGNIANYT